MIARCRNAHSTELSERTISWLDWWNGNRAFHDRIGRSFDVGADDQFARRAIVVADSYGETNRDVPRNASPSFLHPHLLRFDRSADPKLVFFDNSKFPVKIYLAEFEKPFTKN